MKTITFNIPEDLINDLVNSPSDESYHLHIGYWILDELKRRRDDKTTN